MKQIKIIGSMEDYLVTIFSDGTVEVEHRGDLDALWSPYERDFYEITDQEENME